MIGLVQPEQIALANAVIKLPDGSVSLQSLDKNGARWTSKGAAAGVPLNYLAQFSQGDARQRRRRPDPGRGMGARHAGAAAQAARRR